MCTFKRWPLVFQIAMIVAISELTVPWILKNVWFLLRLIVRAI